MSTKVCAQLNIVSVIRSMATVPIILSQRARVSQGMYSDCRQHNYAKHSILICYVTFYD